MFSKYVERSNFKDKALKCHLRCALSEKLLKQLVSINFKDLSYQQLVQECQTQDNQLRAASLNVCKTSPRFQLSVKLLCPCACGRGRSNNDKDNYVVGGLLVYQGVVQWCCYTTPAYDCKIKVTCQVIVLSGLL